MGQAVAHDAVLWLWVTNSFLLNGDGPTVCRSWGFDPKQIVTWIKSKRLPATPEEWRPLVRCPRYEISDHGRVRTTDRKQNSRGTGEWTIIKPRKNRGNYLRVSLFQDGHRSDPDLHVLVAETFLGPRPTPETEIDHIDGCKDNAAAVNLEYVTPSENMKRAWDLDLIRPRPQIGMGHYLRGASEHVILATRGKATSLVQVHNLPNVIVAARQQHSVKPDVAYKLFEELTPGPRLELFARQSRAGWDAVGDQLHVDSVTVDA